MKLGHEIFKPGHEIFKLGHEIFKVGHEIFKLGHEIFIVGHEKCQLGHETICFMTEKWTYFMTGRNSLLSVLTRLRNCLLFTIPVIY